MPRTTDDARRWRSACAAVVAVAVFFLAACGGGGGRSAAEPRTVPSTRATTTTTAAAPTVTPTTSAPEASAPPATDPPSAPSTAPSPQGPRRGLPIASTTYQFVDSSRPTRTASGVLVAGSRSLPTTVWYPTSGPGPWPLVVFGHGFEIGPRPYDRLCEQWAAAGYVVASPSFPLTDGTRAGPYLDENDMINQPSDMSFLITSLLDRSAAPPGTDPLAGLLDPTRIAVAGHSDGATTALAVGYYPATPGRPGQGRGGPHRRPVPERGHRHRHRDPPRRPR